MSIADKIRELEEEIARTQYNKATEHHIGLLKARIARLRRELAKRSKSKGEGFEVKKGGDSTVVMVGFPSVGKSSLLRALTGKETEIGEFAFTTLNCVPGMMVYKGAHIQILDLPGILKGASQGIGRGREVLSVARHADLIMIVLDVYNPHREVIVRELFNIGIRLDRSPPDVTITKKHRGGLSIKSTVELTKIDEKTVRDVVFEYGIHNGEVVIRQDIDVDELIDALTGNRVYVPSLTVVNKVDLVTEDYLKNLNFDFIPVSAETGLNISLLKEEIYSRLSLIRVFTKRRGEEPDFENPMILRDGSTVRDACLRLHKDMVREFRYAQVWGPSARHPGQRVGLDHVLKDGDIVMIITKTGNI